MSLGLHLLELEITTRCNLNCKHCYNRSFVKKDLEIKTITNFIDFCFENKVYTLVFTGGEACLHPKFEDITKYLKKKIDEKSDFKPRLVLQSNGILLTKFDRSLLDVFDLFHISYDISDAVRTSIDHIPSTIDYLKENDLNPYLFSTIHKANIDRLDDMIKFASSSDVDISFNIIQPSKQTEHLGFNKREYMEVCNTLYNLYKDKKILRPSCPLISLLDKDKSLKEYQGNKGGCTAGIAACSIDAEGNVLPCAFLRKKCGNIFKESLKDIWANSKIFKVLRDRSRYDEPCRSCDRLSYCGGCRSRAYEATGKLTGHDPMCFRGLL